MKVSAETKAKNRQAILDAAARQIREKGPSGIAVAEVMAGAGLTHGGFYNHFRSREDLTVQALDQAIRQAIDLLKVVTGQYSFEAFVDGYLSEQHLVGIADGCPFAATCSEIARQPKPVRAIFAAGLRQYLETGSARTDRAEALKSLCGAVGALTLARAVVEEDRKLATELLSAARAN